MPNKNTCVISLGGSLIVPDNIDWEYLKQFKTVIEDEVRNGWNFLIITGGGKTARKYIAAASEIDASVTSDDKDWIGIHATRLNAHFMRTIFRDIAHPVINTNPHDLEAFHDSHHPILIAAGWRPGCSTDFDAVLLAKYLGIPKLVNFSNIDYVYRKDPREFPDAEKIPNISWKDFRKIVGDSWEPGLNAPFDPVASKLAQQICLEVAIVNGKKLDNFQKYLRGEEFEGTIIYGE